MSNSFLYDSPTANLANNKGWYIEFIHVPTARSVRFKAFITDYNEAFESRWNEEHVYGRQDPMMTFQGTSRKISLAWDVVAGSVSEAIDNQVRCGELIKMLYPTFEQHGDSVTYGQITASPVFKIKFANIITNAQTSPTFDYLVGTLSGLQYTPLLDAGWADPQTELYPKVIALSTQITVLHTHKLGFDHDSKEWRGGETTGTSFPFKAQGAESTPTTSTSNSRSDVEETQEEAAEDQVTGGGQ